MAEPTPSMIAVPPAGLEEAEVFRLLGLTWREVYPLLGDVLLSPRDYRYPSRPHYATNYYTAAGVRALVFHFDLPLTVQDSEPAAPEPKAPRSGEAYWWNNDDL